MPEKFQVLYFSPDFPDNIETLDFLAVQDLDGDFVMSYLMETDCKKNQIIFLQMS